MNNLNHLHNASVDRDGFRASKVEQMIANDPEGVERRGSNKATSEIEVARQKFTVATDGILDASARMNSAFAETAARTKTAVGKAKDQAAQVSDAMNRITKMIGGDFEKRLDQLVTLTDCLERLAALDKAGKLDSLMKALR